MILIHDETCAEYVVLGHPERPARVSSTVRHLRRVFPGLPEERPRAATNEQILAAHTRDHLDRIRKPEDFDADTKYVEGIADHAALAAGAAITAVDSALLGKAAFSLMRPPGHHACRSLAMGFCYVNNVAVAALHARRRGIGRIAVWDFDAHHGNGTEEILRDVADTLVVSVHQYPGYPGTGLESGRSILNYPVDPGADPQVHLEILESSWESVVKFRPELILVSAGFDAYRGDPLTDMTLEREDFCTLGEWCRTAPAPVAAALEGGYSDDLPELVEAYLRGWGWK